MTAANKRKVIALIKEVHAALFDAAYHHNYGVDEGALLSRTHEAIRLLEEPSVKTSPANRLVSVQ
jgi:hypothetical protein